MLRLALRYISAILIVWCLSIGSAVSATSLCAMLGPNSTDVHDYHDASQQTLLGLVNKAHFGPTIQTLKRGTSSGLIGPDLNYALDVFPNHYKALDVASRLSIKQNTPKVAGARCTVEGWFERAIEFRPKDPFVRMAYGMHLHRLNKTDQAIEQFKLADKFAPDNANLAYNLGLLYFDLKQYDKAMTFAEKAYTADFPLDGLKKKLKQVGKWVEPKPVAPKNEETKVDKPVATDAKANETNN
jgi:tetratricopeptide (TPR) repeat protein